MRGPARKIAGRKISLDIQLLYVYNTILFRNAKCGVTAMRDHDPVADDALIPKPSLRSSRGKPPPATRHGSSDQLFWRRRPSFRARCAAMVAIGLTIHASFPSAAIGAPASPVWIVTHSRPTPAAAAEKALSLVGQVQHQISVFQARNGVYTVVLGPVWPRSAESIKNAYVSQGIVPSDAFVSDSGRCCVTPVSIAAALSSSGSGPPSAEAPVAYRVYESRYLARGSSRIGVEVGKGLDWVFNDEPVVSLEIGKIFPGSRLPNHAIKAGDHILSADRYVFRSVNDFVNYVTNRNAGSTTLLEILPRGAVSTERAAVEVLSQSEIGPIADIPETKKSPPPATDSSSGNGWGWVVLGGLGLLCLAFCGSSRSGSSSGSSGSTGRSGSSSRSSEESPGDRLREQLQIEENNRRLRGEQ